MDKLNNEQGLYAEMIAKDSSVTLRDVESRLSYDKATTSPRFSNQSVRTKGDDSQTIAPDSPFPHIYAGIP